MDVYDKLNKIAKDLNSLERRIGAGGGGGEANTGGNLGAGVGVYDGKVGVQLQFRSLVGAAGIDVTLDAVNDEIDIALDADLDDLNDVNVPAPANNDVLAWNAGAAEWRNISLGGLGAGAMNFFAHRKVGRYYGSAVLVYSGMTTTWLTNGNIYAVPFIVPVEQDFDEILINCSSGVANAVGRLGLYDDDGDCYPDNLLHGTAELDFSAAGDKSEAIVETLTPGLYWLAILIGTANPQVRAWYYNYQMFPLLGHTAGNDFIPYYFLYGAEAYGAMPDPFPGGITERDSGSPPCLFLKRA